MAANDVDDAFQDAHSVSPESRGEKRVCDPLWAAKEGHWNLFLTKNVNREGITVEVFMLAVRAHRADVVPVLITEYGVDPDVREEGGFGALHYAHAMLDFDMKGTLHDHLVLHQTTLDGVRAVDMALPGDALADDVVEEVPDVTDDTLSLFIERILSEPKSELMLTSLTKTLTRILRQGRLEVLLIQRPAPDMRQRPFYTTVEWMIAKNYFTFLKWILLYARTNNERVFFDSCNLRAMVAVAMTHRRFAILEMFFRNGVDPNMSLGEEFGHTTVLTYAAESKDVELVRLMVRCKGDPNIFVGPIQINPVMAAISAGHPRIVEFLLQHGGSLDLQAQGYRGDAFPMSIATNNFDVPMLEYLHDKGQSLRMEGHENVLTVFARKRWQERRIQEKHVLPVVKWLLAHDLPVTTGGPYDGTMPLKIAIQKKYMQVVGLLLPQLDNVNVFVDEQPLLLDALLSFDTELIGAFISKEADFGVLEPAQREYLVQIVREAAKDLSDATQQTHISVRESVLSLMTPERLEYMQNLIEHYQLA